MLAASLKSRTLQGLSSDGLEVLACQLLHGKDALSVLFPKKAALRLEEIPEEALDDLKTESRFVAANGRLAKSILKLVQQKADLGRGLDAVTWKLVERARESLLEQADGKQKVLIAQLAWNAGLYSLCLDFGHLDPFELAFSAIMLGKRPLYGEALSRLGVSDSLSILKRMALEVLRLRIDGEHLRSAGIFESDIAPLLNKLQTSLDDGSEDAEKALSEIMMIGATTYFYIAQYSKSLDLNSRAYEALSFLASPSRAAVAAFNACVAANHMNREQEVTHWLARAREQLDSYEVPGLLLSLQLFDAERNTGAANFDRALKQVELLLESPALSATQRIVALQTRGRVLTELGRLIEAEVSLVQARSLIAQSSFQQFYVQQSALELELQNFTFRQTATAPRDAGKHVTARSTAWLKLAMIRSAIVDGNRAVAEKRFNDFSVETPFFLQTTMYKRDIEIHVMKLLSAPETRPRGMLSQVFFSMAQNNVSHLQYLLENWTPSGAPLADCAILLARTLVSLAKGDTVGARDHAASASELCERHGLDRVQAILLAILTSLDPAYQARWMRLLRSIPSGTRDHLRELLTPFIDSSVGANVWSNIWAVTSGGIDLSRPGQSNDEVELVIDQGKGTVVFRGQELPLNGQSILFRLLVQIALSQSQGIDKAGIAQLTWGFNYDPTAHDSLIYVNVRRLRKHVPIELYEGRYRLSSRITWKVLTNSSLDIEMRNRNLTERQLAIVNLARFSSHRTISRKEIAHTFRISPRTALRELSDLVELNLLARSGKGRSAIYSLKGHGV